ncbi:TetR/AcrR family transcriptional regulator [Gordonia sp. CPCC 206044]|uniref:TetR/AcrR family transcriptional regulator n=1 Tax=Gordonia sp. CPCC 206044 TaxID=3140793 RepID=UPI003AF34D49
MTRVRNEQTANTRQRILATAEQLFAEQGISSVSNRQISDAAGQANNFAVGYHFGGRSELVHAILDHHNTLIEPFRSRMVAALGPEPDLRDWVTCLVQPQTDYFESLGKPTYFARFTAQVSVDPKHQLQLYDHAVVSEDLMSVLTGLYGSLPDLPEDVLGARDSMARNMILYTIADFESADAAGTATGSWSDVKDYLVDGLLGLWLAPVTHPTR